MVGRLGPLYAQMKHYIKLPNNQNTVSILARFTFFIYSLEEQKRQRLSRNALRCEKCQFEKSQNIGNNSFRAKVKRKKNRGSESE